jgi:hypothetical protein
VPPDRLTKRIGNPTMLIDVAPTLNNSRVIADMAPSGSVQNSSVVERLGRSLVARSEKLSCRLRAFPWGP